MQRTDEWFEIRAGRFTGSEINKLMGIKGLGETGKTYAREKAYDIVFGRDKDEGFTSFAMQRGIDLEPLAFEFFAERQFFDVEKCGFFTLGDNLGASPDGITSDGGCLEIKCPDNKKVLGLIAGEPIDTNYIWQMQCEMLVTNSAHCYFFNYGIRNDEVIFHEIVVEADKGKQDLILERVEEAVKIRDEYVQILLNNKQF